MTLTIEPKHTAILSIDLVNDIIGISPGAESAVDSAAQVLEAGRGQHVPVLHITVAFDAEYRDAPRHHPVFQMAKQYGILKAGTPGTDIHARVKPLPSEPVLRKTCINPFLTTNLQQRLVGLGVDTLIVMGLSTNYAVESTVRHAADLGYRVIVVRDACASSTVENHEFAVNHILPTLAIVSSKDEILQALARQ